MSVGMQSPFNPTVLLNLLVGAGREAGQRSAASILTKLKEDIRSEIDSSLPVIYLYDAEVIVDSMLNILSPENSSEIELGKYLSLVLTDTGPSSFSSVIKSKNKKEQDIIIKGDDDVLLAYSEAYNKLLDQRNTLISEVQKTISSEVSNTITVSKITNTVNLLHNELTSLIAKVVALGTPTNIVQNSRLTRVIRGIGSRLRRITTNLAKVSDPESLVSNFDSTKQVLILSQNFNNSKTRINKAITKKLEDKFKALGVKVNSTGFQAGFFSAAGHVGIQGGGITNINTPQLQTAKLILAQAGIDSPDMLKRFIQETSHNKWTIEISKDQIANSNNLLSLGISFVRSQPFVFNSGELSSQEVNFINKEIESLLGVSYKQALDTLKKNASNNPQFYNYLVASFRMSPTIVEGILSQVVESLKTGKSSSRIKSKKQGSLGKSGISTSIKTNTKKKNVPKQTTKKPTSVPINVQNNLASLQDILNANLAQKIKENMGDGSRRDILNLRSGRLAESAKVERLSESRAGMITAFYTYMKNPYATFSDGGRQQYPKSRDPKLLISKSIREIAAAQVNNRLRAVLV